ncbi:MAG: hypothetical protein WC385_01285 [Candidatus Paceibacterota bacterium]|jgi:hypothetical protein
MQPFDLTGYRIEVWFRLFAYPSHTPVCKTRELAETAKGQLQNCPNSHIEEILVLTKDGERGYRLDKTVEVSINVLL